MLVYTITEGVLRGEDKECSVPFALVFLENGVYFFESLLQAEFYARDDFNKWHSFSGVTEKGYGIEVEGLTYQSYRSDSRKARFVCRRYVKLINNKSSLSKGLSTQMHSHYLWHLELEGLQMELGDKTEVLKYRGYGQVDDPFNFEFDHTSCSMFIEIEGYEENYFHLLFTKPYENGNVHVDFSKWKQHGKLTYEHFKEFRSQFVGFLSLLNGGQVSIRRELTGRFHNPTGVDSHIVYNYSFSSISASFVSDYVPINEHWTYSSPIFREAFRKCFNLYYKTEQSLKLNEIVASINESFRTTRIEESYSILINALERMSSDLQKLQGQQQGKLINEKEYKSEIEPLLSQVILKAKKILSDDKTALLILQSKIGALNNRNERTVQKLAELMKFGCIPVNESVSKLILSERHKAVHEGVIGLNSEEIYVNHKKLDHILRDIVLNIIDYRNRRKVVEPYATTEECEEVYPKRQLPVPSYYISVQ